MGKIEVILAKETSILQRCLVMRNLVFTVEKKVPKEIEVDEYDELGGVCDHFLIQREGEDVGAVRCRHMDADTIKVQRFCVLDTCRGFGVGKVALESIEDAYKLRGKTCMELDSKYAVYEFYEKCGYERVSDVFIEADVEHVKMVKKL